ncbi:MAG: FecR domain-containing protein [Candidatus Pseudobacter hemicellulosilyticus]|uniref:FecR domain-containing protein n=1 Tax=Candidatus Pseudobacter hemicellulosilyticus TaxID=3121375 RepID=A0AAJ6BG00_9BACT|nr:MAG: FecR domain-containing protein [Pseudobacter sp.]
MDNNQQQQFRDFLHKYQQGDSSPDEKRSIDHWYEALEPGETNYSAAHPIWASLAAARLRKALPGLQPKTGQRIPVRRIMQWTAAAVLTGLVATGFFYLLQPTDNTSGKPLYTTISTGHNQIKTITLPDGSRVWLNRFSTIEWAGNFGDSARTIQLSGEARFEVTANAGKPFLVRAGGTTTRVLGTMFNITAYPEEQELKVALLNGSVQFVPAGERQPVLLKPGTMSRYRQADSAVSIVAIDQEIDAWTTGATVFNEQPLTEAIARIARQQQWKLVWKNKKRLNGTVSAIFRRETAAQMLDGLAFTHSFHYTIEQDTLIIY